MNMLVVLTMPSIGKSVIQKANKIYFRDFILIALENADAHEVNLAESKEFIVIYEKLKQEY